ncbi:MAG: hypothetical protein ACFFD2_25330 [Promethearchaeota archaeon]
MEAQLREMIMYLVKQQFSGKGDIIIDRMKTQTVKITGSGRVIDKFIDILGENVSEILMGNFKKYLKEICDKCGLEMEGIFQSFSERIAVLEPEEQNAMLILSTLMGEFLGAIRDASFAETLLEIQNRVKKGLKLDEAANLEFEKDFTEKVGNLFERNEPNLSFLYNLCFLEFIARLHHSQKVRRTTKIILGKYMNRVAEKIRYS